jgi:AAA+ superfamily predicted ATPase
MFNFNPSQNPVLDAIEKIYDATKDSCLKTEQLDTCKNEIELLSNFFNATDEQVVLLALMIQSQFEDNNCSIKELLSHLDLRTSSALMLNEILIPIVNREWIAPKKDAKLYPLTEYQLTNKLIRSVLTGKMENFETPEIKNSFQLLSRFQLKLAERTNNRINYKQFIQCTFDLIQNNPQIDLSDFIIKMNMQPEDIIQFMYLCLQHYLGNENCDFDSIIRDLAPSREEQYQLRNSYKSGTNFLLTSGLLKESVSNDIFGGITYFLSEKAVHAFDKNAVVKNRMPEGILTQLEPSGIVEKKLIFEENEQQMVTKLHNMLGQENFSNLTERLQSQGMKKGISVLLYGHPGTGKTETVLQLGKNSNRFVLLADASKIRSKWVGDTAKNVKALFDEYRKAMKEFDETPILLFNEADAIIGKRHNVTDRGDQEMNTMQNILLEELENFEGIFIATTNLVDNLDKAFDRRFLYKIRFDKPGTEARKKILKNKFPELSSSAIKKISENYQISGAQIENIRKKTIVDKLLNENLKFNYQYIESLIKMEISLELKNQNRTPIVFIAK